jgi:hypothetical protein
VFRQGRREIFASIALESSRLRFVLGRRLPSASRIEVLAASAQYTDEDGSMHRAGIAIGLLSTIVFGCVGLHPSSGIRLTGAEKQEAAESRSPAPWSANPAAPINQMSLFRAADGWVHWAAPDGFVYSLNPASVREGTWGVVRDTAGKAVLAYLWRDGMDSFLAVSIDGANSGSAGIAAKAFAPSRVLYFGVAGPGDLYNPLGRPGVVIRSTGIESDAPLLRGERLEVVTIAPDVSFPEMSFPGNVKVKGDLVVDGNKTGANSGVRSSYRRNPNKSGHQVACPDGQFVTMVRLLDTDGGRFCSDCASHVSVICAKP